MKRVENGHFVKVDYTGKMENGDVFHTTANGEPVEIEVGAGKIIRGFEDELIGMSENEKKTFTLAPEKGFGPRDENLTHEYTRSDLPPDVEPKVGDVVGLQTPEGAQVPARVTYVDDEKVSLDLNHPLAGQALSFDVKVLEINDEPAQSACSPSSCGSCCSSCS